MKKYNMLWLTGLLILIACGSSKQKDPSPANPAQATMVLPVDNALCTQGIPGAAGHSTVTFQWNLAANTDNYELDIKNLLTGVPIARSTSATQLAVDLAENTPYSWSVTSKSTKISATATSATWKFYNSGPGTIDYAPFPAELTTPIINASVAAPGGTVTLGWSGSDVDNGALTYDLYFGTTTDPSLLKSDITLNSYDVNVATGKSYYWKIVTKDAAGNDSESAVYKFNVN